MDTKPCRSSFSCSICKSNEPPQRWAPQNAGTQCPPPIRSPTEEDAPAYVVADIENVIPLQL